MLAEPGDELTFRIVTMEAGDLVWEKFGHNTIWMRDTSTGEDVIYNWGMFDFDQKDFFYNFAIGRLKYWMEGFDPAGTLNAYASHNRSIWSQELDLSPKQKLKLKELLRFTEQPENRTYDYNYYNDNCSTRVRDAIDQVVDGQIKAQLESKPTQTTYRWHTRRLTRSDLPWYTLLNTVLGPNTDRPINAWEEAFLPIKFRDQLRSLTIRTEDGREIPIVKAERVLFKGTRLPEPDAPPNWIAYYFLVGAAIGLVLLGLWKLAKGKRWAKVLYGLAATSWVFLIGLCSLVGIHFWFFSNHWSAWRNENLFGYSPLALPLIVLLPVMLMRKSKRIISTASLLAILLAGSTLLGILLHLLTILKQVNGEPMALVVAPNLALAWTVWKFTQSHEMAQLSPAAKRAA